MTIDTTYRPILLVEDNPVDLDLTQRALAKSNLRNKIEVARDGEEALAWLPRWQNGEPLPVVILLDIKLPKIDGLEVLRKFRANPKTRLVPVVVLTSSAENKDIEAAYLLGANSYIVKPVIFEKFLGVAEHIKLYWALINQAPQA